MLISPKEQLKKSNTNSFLLSLLVVLFIFSAPIMNFVLILIGKANQSGQLAIVYIFCTIALFLYMVFNKIHVITKSVCAFCFLPICLFFLFEYTKFTYSSVNIYFNSEMLSALAIWPATIIIGILLQYNGCKPINKQMIILIDVILTSLIVYGVSFSGSTTSAGLQQDDSGLLYQNISYYAAYSIGMTIYLFEETRNKFYRELLIILLMGQFLFCCIAGGRGGVVLAGVLFLYYAFIKYKFRVLNFLIPFFLFILVIPYIVQKLGNHFELNLTGFNRIFDFVYGVSMHDAGRQALWKRAFEMFESSPAFGNGLGSTFYVMNSYSHNLFMDLLAETGIVGTFLFILLLLVFFKRVYKYYNTNALCRWMMVIFISGITMNLFSGYIWANQMFWVPLVTMMGIIPVKAK